MELPLVKQIQEELKDRPELQILAVEINDDRAGADRFIAENDLHFIFATADRDFVETNFDTRGYPNSFIIGKDGRLKQHHLGFRAEMAPTLKEELLAELDKEL